MLFNTSVFVKFIFVILYDFNCMFTFNASVGFDGNAGK